MNLERRFLIERLGFRSEKAKGLKKSKIREIQVTMKLEYGSLAGDWDSGSEKQKV